MKTIQCSYCGYYIETEEDKFAYCPICEKDDVEVQEDDN